MKPFHWSAQRVWLTASALGLLMSGPVCRGAEGWGGLGDPRNEGWFVRAGARALFNVKASVSRVDQPVIPGIWDDGFVLPDIGGTTSGRTWNWGYENSAQLAGGQVRMSRERNDPMAGLFNHESNDPSLGAEILGGMELGRFYVGDRQMRFGFELGYGYNSFSLDHRSSASSVAMRTVAAYDLGGTVAPVAPYTGSYQGPGPLLNLQPSMTSSLSSPSYATFDGTLNSDLHNFKAGIWMEYPLTRRLVGAFSFGYSSIYGDSQLKFTESISFDNPAFADIPLTRKTVGGRDWKAGTYLQVRLRYDFSRHVAAYIGGDLSYHGNLDFEGEGRKVKMDFGGLFGGSAGLVIGF